MNSYVSRTDHEEIENMSIPIINKESEVMINIS